MSENIAASCHVDESNRELEELELQMRMECVACKLLVLSGKGGVGKSTVAVNLAMALAKAGKKVGLLDVDLHGPSVPKMLGLDGRRIVSDAAGVITPIQVNDNLKVVSVGLLLDSSKDAVIWRGPLKYKIIRQFLKDVAWGSLDYLVIDSPPGTGDEPLAVAQLVGADALAVVVTTPQDVAIADVRRSISFCEKLELEVAGIVENMSGFICPCCNQQTDLFKAGGGEKLAAEAGVPFLGRIPLDPRIMASGDNGLPFAAGLDESPAARAFAAAIQPILKLSQPEPAKSVPGNIKETRKMKIAIPMADGKLCMHFGHCEQFALVTVEAGTISATTYLTPPPHEPGLLPRWLHELGADVIIAGGMGQRAQSLFAENDIKVVVGAPAQAPAALVNAYLADTLEVGQNVCDH